MRRNSYSTIENKKLVYPSTYLSISFINQSINQIVKQRNILENKLYHSPITLKLKMSTSTMTMSPQSITIQPISVPSSDVDFGAVIENVDLENLSGKLNEAFHVIL